MECSSQALSWKESPPYSLTPCQEAGAIADGGEVLCGAPYGLAFPFPYGHFPADSPALVGRKLRPPQGSPCQAARQLLSSLQARGEGRWSCANPCSARPSRPLHGHGLSTSPLPCAATYPGPTASRRYASESAHEGFSICSTSRPNSRFKEEPYEHNTVGQTKTEARLHNPQQVTKEDSKMQFIRDPKDSLGCVEKPLPGPLASPPLSKASCEHPRPLHGLSQHLPMQVVLEQRRRLCMVESQYAHLADHAALEQTDSNGERGAPRLTEQGGEEEQRMFMGQAPYVSLNFHHVLAKHGSFQAPPYALAGHLTDNYSYRGEEVNPYIYKSQSPASSSSPETHREIPHYIGTSVIITNER